MESLKLAPFFFSSIVQVFRSAFKTRLSESSIWLKLVHGRAPLPADTRTLSALGIRAHGVLLSPEVERPRHLHLGRAWSTSALQGS